VKSWRTFDFSVMVQYYNFKDITVVPTAKDFVDIILSKLQRKTPTVIRKSKPLPQIRKFYTRKVRTAQQFFTEKLDNILKDFPYVEQLHPFYKELINVHFNKDKFSIALANISKAKRKIDRLGQDYVRKLKYCSSLYQCKCQKRIALGQMVKYISKLKATLGYLEEVRQKMSRLPNLDPTLRTVILCGFPNVGKSSFLNKVTRADVEVQPYAFTTKHLYLGHTEYQYGRYQVVDTPGLLDREFSERNETEMATVTALVCLDACILYIMDASLHCGKTIEQQAQLFQNIRPCFKESPIMIAINKTDVRPIESLNEDERVIINSLATQPGVHGIMQMSTLTENGVMEVRNKACSLILERRVEEQVRQAADDEQKREALRLKTYVTQPKQTADRPPIIPEAVFLEKSDNPPPKKLRKLERDIELEEGDEYVTDLRKHWELENEEEKYDSIPEIWMGHNVIDFYDPNINTKLAQLEEEEARLVASGFYDPEQPETAEEKRIRKVASKIREVMALRKLENREKKAKGPKMPRRSADANEIASTMGAMGIEINPSEAPHIRASRSRSLKRAANRQSVSPVDHARSESRPRPRSESGMRDPNMVQKALLMRKKTQKRLHREARKGEADRHVPDLKPKHLYSGKRKMGKTQRR
jgi:nucleolar GTP-binding protein